jgi:hypothetical protein
MPQSANRAPCYAALLGLSLALLNYAASAPAADNSVAALLGAIERQESRSDAYSPALGELYYSLGRALTIEQAHDEALDAYQTGMQIERINDGLRSLNQLPYLFAIADSHQLLGDSERATDALYSAYHIAIDHHGEQSEALLPVLHRLLEWQLNSYQSSSPRAGFSHLINADKVAGHLLSVLLGLGDRDSRAISTDELVAGYQQVIEVNYTIAEHLERHGLPGDSGFSFTTVQIAERRPAANSQASYRNGKIALEQIILERERANPAAPAELAEAVAALGDWYLEFGQQRSATEAYQLAYQLTLPAPIGAEQEEQKGPTSATDSPGEPVYSALGEQLFGQPRAIEFNRLSRNLARRELVVEVDNKGLITDFEWPITERLPAQADQRKVLNQLKKLRVRPTIDPAGTRASRALIALPANSALLALIDHSAVEPTTPPLEENDHG